MNNNVLRFQLKIVYKFYKDVYFDSQNTFGRKKLENYGFYVN